MNVRLHQVKLSGLYFYCYAKDYLKARNKAQAICEELNIEFVPCAELPAEESSYFSHSFTQANKAVVITDAQLISLSIKSFDFSYEHEVNVTVDPSELFAKVAGKQELVIGEGNTYNNKCDVHMPGNTLTSYNEVMLMEDQCTDRLQDTLSQGWRVIAVCPQPNQRRPDYILGRFNPNIDPSAGAARG